MPKSRLRPKTLKSEISALRRIGQFDQFCQNSEKQLKRSNEPKFLYTYSPEKWPDSSGYFIRSNYKVFSSYKDCWASNSRVFAFVNERHKFHVDWWSSGNCGTIRIHEGNTVVVSRIYRELNDEEIDGACERYAHPAIKCPHCYNRNSTFRQLSNKYFVCPECCRSFPPPAMFQWAPKKFYPQGKI